MKILEDKSFRKAALVGILLFMIFEIIITFLNAYTYRAEEADLYKKSYAIQSEIEKMLLNVLTISDAYNSFITENPDAIKEDTEEFLKHVFEYEERYVRNIAFVEDTTIKFNYPYEENASSIGADLSQIDEQREYVLYIKNNLDSIFIGPVDLVQGGTAFILGTPVIVDGAYLGHIATVIDADQFVELLEEQAEQYNVGLVLSNPNEDSFFSIDVDFERNSIKNSIENKHVLWELELYDLEVSNAVRIRNLGIRGLGILVLVLVSSFVYRNDRLIREVKTQAIHDALTMNYNRAKFIDDFNSNKIVGKLIAFMDINKFKILNDTLGHHFGDWGLIQISNEFNSSGKFDTYRNSGDEFFLVSKEPMTEKEFLNYTDQFNSSFYNESLQQNIDISLAVGVIEKVSSDLKFEDMLVYLDYAMYDAKKQKITYTLVDDELMIKYKKQKQVEKLLIEDIKSNKFLLYYQPIIDIENQRIESVEVLSRWMHEGKLISAWQFIEVVKKIKYIEEVDHNLINNLQEQYKTILDACPEVEHIDFTINLSAELLKGFEKDFNRFDKYIEQLIIPRNKVIFEISEDINLGIISDETLEYIKGKGFSLVIDDFGSGVSKLSDVLSGKLLAIKTDKSMLPIDKFDVQRLKGFNTIVKAINSTGSLVCVEGVETKDQMDIAVNAGCKLMQGYLFAKPMPMDEIVNYIKTFDFDDYSKL